jgi:heat shock protein 5
VTPISEAKISTTDLLIKQYKRKTGTNVSKNLRALIKLKGEVERAKRTFSSQQNTRVEIEGFEDGNNFSESLTRAKFEEFNMDFFRKTMEPVEQVLKDVNIKKDTTSEVVLVGGSTRIPKVQQLRNPPRASTLMRLWLTVLLSNPRWS